MARRARTIIHHEAHGQGAPVLLTHGFGATCRMWDEQFEDLTDRWRLIAWDLPGHGESTAPAAARYDAVAAMEKVLDAEEAERAVLIGLGVGGALSLRFWRARPDRVRALVLIGTMPGLRSPGARAVWNAQVEAQATALERGGLAALEGGAEADPRLHGCPLGLAAAARALLVLNDDGALSWLTEIAVPVLVLVGSEDKPNLTASQYMARTIPGARMLIVPRANHAANIHKPEVVNAALREFLGKVRK